MNHLSEIDAWGAPQVVSSIFGGSASLAAMYRSKEMFETYLKGSCRRNRCITMPSAARSGRTELVHFTFNYEIEASPWRFDPEIRNKDEIRALAQALTTPDPNTWEFIMEMHIQYTVPVPSSRHTSVLQTCAQKGWTDMARHFLEYGSDPDGCAESSEKTPIFFAAEKGHLEVVQALLGWNVKTHNDALKAAAANGHLKAVELLLIHHCSKTGAIVAAAQSGYGDIVKTLLESGADANEDDGNLSAICYAIITEHASMFRCLIEHGANPQHRR
jgi:ankyrin repeat protein